MKIVRKAFFVSLKDATMTVVKDNKRTSWIMSINSASVGFCPSERMTVPSSLVVMVPTANKSETKRVVSAFLRVRVDASTDRRSSCEAEENIVL